MHTPEFAFEHDAFNVANAISRFGIHYPVVQDNEYGTWNAYGNQSWPADYLIDASGQVRYAAIGEGDYVKTESAIRALLAEAGDSVGTMSHPTGAITPSSEATPETYLGTARAQGWTHGPVSGLHDYGSSTAANLGLNEFAYGGSWKIAGAACHGHRRRHDRRRGAGQERLPRTQLGRPAPTSDAGAARRPADPRSAGRSGCA